MHIQLDGDLLKQLIDRRFKYRIMDLQAEWANVFGDGNRAPDQATIYRWMKGKMPRTKEEFLRLCGILDVDPVALLLPADGDRARAIEFLQKSFLLEIWKPHSLAFLADFFRRQSDWPPGAIALRFFGRPWYVQEFCHDPEKRKNYYALVKIMGLATPHKTNPQVFHFAYRHPKLFQQRWLQYGFVVRSQKAVELSHINGHIEDCPTTTNAAPIYVETWCGPGPAIFRIASLQKFSATLEDTPGKQPRVRFPG